MLSTGLPGPRARAFHELEVEAVLDTQVDIVVACGCARGGRHVPAQSRQPRSPGYSTTCAVPDFWLATRAEGLGVGWIGFFDERALAAALGLPGLPAGASRTYASGTSGISSRAGSWCSAAQARGGRCPGPRRREVGPPRLPTPPASLITDAVATIGPLDTEAVARAAAARER